MVEWKKIWEVTIWDKRFQGVDKSMQAKIKQYPYLLAKDLFALARPYGDIKLLSTGVQEGWTTKEVADKYLCEGEIVSIPWGKSPGAKNPVKYYKGKFVTGDNRIATSSDLNVLNNKYLYYWLVKNNDLLETFYRGAGIQHPSMYMVLTMDIPLLPISEQTRIVGILDTFTSAIDNLKEQIAQRRKQYEYYRDQLLDLEGKEGVEMKTLGEICEIKGRIGFRGYTRDDQVAEGEGVISLSPGNIEDGKMVYDGCTYITWTKYEESPEIKTFNGDILFCKTGSTVGKVAMVEHLPYEATINPQLVVLKNVSINAKFLKYTLGTYRIQSEVKRLAGIGSVPNISQEKLGNLEILLPSLSEQQRIVSILDTFEASIQNLEVQLSQREKQYEYYRNKLLTFE